MDIGLFYDSGSTPGIEIADTGFFLTHLSGELDNLNNISQLVVSASATIDFGDRINVPTIPGIFSGGPFSLVEATGSITVSASELDLSGSVTLLGGLLGQGSASVDLNWGTGVYMVSGQFGMFDNIITFSGSLTINNQGDIDALAMASINIPPQIPFIGGDSLANINFALQYIPGDWTDSYVAAWTSINLLVTSFTIGFKIDFQGDFNLINGDDVQQIEQSVTAKPMQQFFTYTQPITITTANAVGANVAINSASFEDQVYASSGVTTDNQVWGIDAGEFQIYTLSQSNPILPTLQIDVHQIDSNGADVDLGTITFDQNGKFHFQESPSNPGWYVPSNVNVSENGVLIYFPNDPGQTYINASYEVSNGAYLELLQQSSTNNQYEPVTKYAIDPVATPGAGIASAGPDDQLYTDMLTNSAPVDKSGTWLSSFTLTHGSPDLSSMVVNVYSQGSGGTGTLLGQVTFPDGIYHFTPSPNAPFTPVGGAVVNNVLTLDWTTNPHTIAVTAMYRSLTDRVIHINLATDVLDDGSGMPGMYEIQLVQPEDLGSDMPTYDQSIEYQAPTVSLSAGTNVSADLNVKLQASAYTPEMQQANDTSTTVSLYYNTADNTTNGTLIGMYDYSSMTPITGQPYSKSLSLNWAGFQSLAAGNYYVYAVISDGQSAPVYSAISGRFTSQGPTPILTGPNYLTLSPVGSGGVSSVTPTSAGSGYQSVPTVTFTSADGKGSGATATAIVQNGQITGITLTNPGSGYDAPPLVVLSGGNPTMQATATATLTEQAVFSSTIGTNLAVMTNDGGSVTATVTLNGGGTLISPGGSPVTSISQTYSPAPGTVLDGLTFTSDPTFTGSTTLTYTASQNLIEVTNPGSGYRSAPTVTFTSKDGNGSGAAGFAEIENGQVVGVLITNNGLGYDAPPDVSFSGGNPTTPATAQWFTYTATRTIPLVALNTHLLVTQTESGGVNFVTVTNAGSGYQSVPTVTFTSADGKGSGATGIVTINKAGQVVGITVINPGVGYDQAPLVTFTGGNPTTQATATATIVAPPADPTTAILTITVANPGGINSQNGTNVQVQDYLTPGLTVLSATASQGSFDPPRDYGTSATCPSRVTTRPP